MVRCLAFSVVLGMVGKGLLTMKMYYYQLPVISGAALAAQMARSVEAPMMNVESTEFSEATREYQNTMAQ